MALTNAFFSALNQPQPGVVLGLAYMGGVVSTLLPCTVAMLPILVGYVAGLSETRNPWRLAANIALFVVGTSLTLAIMGTVAALLGTTLQAWAGAWGQLLVGVLSLLIGIHLLEWVVLPVPQWMTQLPQASDGLQRNRWLKGLIPLGLGAVYGAASSPCGTPFLAGILALIGQSGQVTLGAVSLFVYGLGQGTLLLVVGVFTGALKRMAVLRHVGVVLTRLSGVIFLGVGLLFLAEGAGLLETLKPVITQWLTGL